MKPAELLDTTLRALRAPDPRFTLGLLRVGLVGWLLIRRTRFAKATLENRLSLPDEVFTSNLGLTLSPLPWPMTEGELNALFAVLVVSGVFALIGAFTRPALFVFALTQWHVGAADSAYGFFNHVPSIFCVVLLLLPLLPGVDALSVDARRRHKTWLGPPAPEWGVTVVLLFLSTVYVGAGVAKLRHGGLTWLSGDILDFYLHADLRRRGQEFVTDDQGRILHYLYNSVPTSMGKALRDLPGFAAALSVVTVVVELGFPLALWRRARPFVLAATIAMHLGIAATISIGFYSTVVILALLLGLPRPVTDRLSPHS